MNVNLGKGGVGLRYLEKEGGGRFILERKMRREEGGGICTYLPIPTGGLDGMLCGYIPYWMRDEG